MSDEQEPTIKVTDRRHFDKTGERRPGADPPTDGPQEPPRPAKSAPTASTKPPSADRPSTVPPAGASSAQAAPAAGAGRSAGAGTGSATGDLSDVALGLSSSFSLLIARLAQETEIYLGLVPYPGKETAEPDIEAARAMIDVLTMLQEKTRGNLDEQESHLLENLLYTYRLEFVRRRSGSDIR